MVYFGVKFLHIIGATVLLGTGAGIAFFMLMAHLRRPPAVVAAIAEIVVIADFVFAATAVVAQPVTGALLAWLTGYPLTEGWIVLSLVLYVITGLFWLPVVWIQIRMRNLAREAVRTIARYHANALTTAQVIEELIRLAKDIRAARARGEETGLTEEEIAFYDALAENESARQVMGEPALRVIAHELVASIKSNVSVDWMHRDTARARMRVLVKRLLRKYGYPPDLQDAAVQKVLQQAEVLAADWAA